MNLADLRRHLPSANLMNAEAYPQPFYDTFKYPKEGVDTLEFFQRGIGQADAQYGDTNMHSAGMLPPPWSFIIQGLEFEFHPGGRGHGTYVRDLVDVLQAPCHVDLQVANRRWYEDGPLDRFAQFPSAVLMAIATMPKGRRVRELPESLQRMPPKLDLYLPSNYTFKVRLVFDQRVKLSAPGRLACRLHGIQVRLQQ